MDSSVKPISMNFSCILGSAPSSPQIPAHIPASLADLAKLLRLNKLAVINVDWHSQMLQAKNADERDLGIVISYSGATTEVVECMKIMKENKTPIIAITRCVNSPVSELADQKLYTTANESVFRSGAMSSRISQLCIIDMLYTALANEDYEASLEQLSRTHIQKPGQSSGKAYKTSSQG